MPIELIGQAREDSLFDLEKKTLAELEAALNSGLSIPEMAVLGWVRAMMATAKVNALVKLLADANIADSEDFAVAHTDALREMIGKLNEQMTKPIAATAEDLQRLKR